MPNDTILDNRKADPLYRGSFFCPLTLYNILALCYHYGSMKQVNVRMTEELKESLEEMAREEGRSLNNLIVHLLKCAVVSNGIIKRASVRKFYPVEGGGKIEANTVLLRKEKEDGHTD